MFPQKNLAHKELKNHLEECVYARIFEEMLMA